MAKITLPDGSKMDIVNGSNLEQLAQQIGPGLAKAAIAAKVNGSLVDLSSNLNQDAQVEIITSRDPRGLDIMRHSCAHVMAEAICSIWPDAKLVYGPTLKLSIICMKSSKRIDLL